jgi:hypothetical protein
VADEENRLELVEARADVDRVERLRQSYGDEGDRMSLIERADEYERQRRAKSQETYGHPGASMATMPPFDWKAEALALEAQLAGAVSALERIRDWDLDPMDDAEYVWDELRKIAVEVIGPRPSTARGQ